MTQVDARGVEIKEGDLVIYTAPGQYGTPEVGYVHKLNGKTKITLRDMDRSNNDESYEQTRLDQVNRNRKLYMEYSQLGKTIPEWLEGVPRDIEDLVEESGMVDARSCYVIEKLPYVEGRLNS